MQKRNADGNAILKEIVEIEQWFLKPENRMRSERDEWKEGI